MTTKPPPSPYLTAKQVRARFGGVSRMWIFRRLRDADFPQPIHLGGGRFRHWRLADVQAWEARMIAQGVGNKAARPGAKA